MNTLPSLRLWLRTTRCWTFWFSVILLGVSLTARAAEIIACGGSRVVIFDASQPASANPKLAWSWDVKEATTLPPQYQKLLVPLDECKPVHTNTQLLLTSSGGGVVLLDRKTRRPLFHAHAPMAHSAEMLPGERIVVALSTHGRANYDPPTQHLVYTKAEISWWTHHIYGLNPTRTFTFPDINLYKARVSSP